ncbi:RDD family protein [Sporosarcina sp. Marseille-Q4063]|uniref:RDD family protein n=1 Tax=Sporosarcina sp. Marseille-Q4063 TaxID=2810514 RepID=UPI001BAF1AAF|nr:RDD family protein [Sporosarcina sp. Marseille-Q4063]QUW20278.1 RDD family protein [Sporosarcina sp. Marseille-Q4063]
MNVTFLIRLKAFLIDYVLIFAYLVLLVVLNIFLFPSIQELFQGSLITAQFMGFLMVTLPISIYFIVCDSVIGGQSIGKKKMGIRVVDANGKALSIPRAIFRTVLKFFPWELSHFLVYRMVAIGDEAVPISYSLIGGVIYALIFVYILTTIFTKNKQSLYDIIAKTYVIKLC